MKKFFLMLSVVTVMFTFTFAMTPKVAQAFNADVIVQEIELHPESDTIDVVLKFINNEDSDMQWWGVDAKMLDIYNPNGEQIFSSGSFTIHVDSEGDFIVPAHSEKLWYCTVDKRLAPNMDKVPDINYDYNAGWRLRWDYFPRCNYAQ